MAGGDLSPAGGGVAAAHGGALVLSFRALRQPRTLRAHCFGSLPQLPALGWTAVLARSFERQACAHAAMPGRAHRGVGRRFSRPEGQFRLFDQSVTQITDFSCVCGYDLPWSMANLWVGRLK